MINAPEQTILTRQSLLSRLKDWSDHKSWKEFFDTYWKLIYNAAIKAGLTDAEAQDVVQDTVVSVLNSMGNGEYDAGKSSFKNWLMRLTNWRIVDQMRKRRGLVSVQELGHPTSTSTSTGVLERVADPASINLQATWDEEWEQNLIEAAIARVKRRVDSQQYQLFDMYVVKQWSVARMARTFKVTPAKIYLAKHRINKLIKNEINHLRAKPI